MSLRINELNIWNCYFDSELLFLGDLGIKMMEIVAWEKITDVSFIQPGSRSQIHDRCT